MFGNQDESDRMLDDDDVAPLNMNLEISEATSSRDESLLDSGKLENRAPFIMLIFRDLLNYHK